MNSLLSELRSFQEQWRAIWLDEDLERRIRRRDELIEWKSEILAKDEEPLVEALRFRGFVGKSVWDLVNTREAYPSLIEPLSAHATRGYLPPTREGIFRSLTVKESDQQVLGMLIDEWVNGVDRDEKFTRWALANAIAYVAKGTRYLEQIGALLDEDEYARDPFVRRLNRSERGRQILADRMQEIAQ
ncbi:MAG: hypothetical protein ACT6Q5_02570 [Sphingopyxis solisilvae]|uniref:hypothetical protein n=1 Tax=Sphingopyxis solisilvae TaxID=1886788 RepID=UPI004035A377